VTSKWNQIYRSSDAHAQASHHHDDDEEHEHQEHLEEGEEGDPWLVSYADLMTLLFGFFVLLYSFAASKIDENAEDWVKVRKEVSRYFNGEKPGGEDSKDPKASKLKTGSESLPVLPFDARLKSLAGDLKAPQLTAQVSELLQREMARQGITLVKDAKTLFSPQALNNPNRSSPSGRAQLGQLSNFSSEGSKWIKGVTDQLIGLKIPLQITVESSQKLGTQTPVTPEIERRELEKSNARAYAVLEQLRQALSLADVPFRGSISAMGIRQSDVASNVEISDAIVIKVYYEEENTDKK
jgi:flagellar motor protein MotB